MHTHISVHDAKDLTASSTGTSGAPLQLCAGPKYSCSSAVILYTGDQILTDRLVVAINEVCEARRKELLPEQAAA